MPVPSFQLASGTSLTTTTTLTLIPGLTLNVVAGATYRFEAGLLFQAAATTAVNLVIGIGGSATFSMLEYATNIQNNVDGSANLKTISGAINTTVLGATAPGATATNYAARLNGVAVINAAGTFQVQARHTSTNAANIQSGSRFILEQVA